MRFSRHEIEISDHEKYSFTYFIVRTNTAYTQFGEMWHFLKSVNLGKLAEAPWFATMMAFSLTEQSISS